MLFDLLRGNMSIMKAIPCVISALTVVFLTLPFHEYAHAFIANKLGDNTAKYNGRLTLNPLAHIDYLGALCIIFFGFGWANPVPVNARNFKNPKSGMALTALAGPVMNLLLALVGALLSTLVYKIYLTSQNEFLIYLIWYFSYFVRINVSLAVFNLIPVPPLDGSRILSVFLSTKSYFAIMKYERYIIWGIFALIFMGVLDTPIAFVSNYIINGLYFVAQLIF